jgi:muramidase (phage lysozyme)
MDERELQQLFEKFQSGVQLTDEEMRKLARDSSAASKAMENAGKIFVHLGKQAVDLTKKLYDGQQGASVYNDAITNTTDALDKFVSNFGILGKAAGFLIKAIGSYAAEANKLSDRLYKNYQTLSQVGISAADGMTGLGDAAQRLGYSLDDAGVADFARLMKSASKDLAALAGSAFEGRKRFTEIADVVKSDAGRELQNLGASTAEINEQIAEFVGQQARIGAAQTRSNQDLRKSAIAYVKELDILAKLTGEEKNRLQEQQRAALGEQQFRARIEELRGKGEFETIQNLQNLQSALATTAGPELARGVRDVIAANGAITTDAAAKASMVLGNRLTDVAQRALKGEDWVGLFNELAGAAGQGTKAFQGVAQFADISDTVGNLSEAYNLANRYIDEEGKLRDRLTGELVKQEQGADGVTGAATDLRRSQLDTTQSLQTLVSKGVTPLTGAMKSLSSVTNTVVKKLGGSAAEAPGGSVSTGGGATRGGGSAAAGASGGKAPRSHTTAALADTSIARGLSGVLDQRFATSSAIAPSSAVTDKLLDYIGKKESGGNYNILHGGKTLPDLSEMTVAQVLDFQAQMLKQGHESTAVGKYQILRKTLAGLVDQGVVSATDRFSASTQDKLAVALLQGRGLDKYLSGKLSADQFADSVAREWASLPMASGKSAYAGVGSNRALGSRQDYMSVFARDGGVFSGPKSGYAATLHGNEAVVPLPNGKTIPVSMPGYSDSMEEQMNVMGAQLAALENIVAAMRDQNSISTKILQAANA